MRLPATDTIIWLLLFPVGLGGYSLCGTGHLFAEVRTVSDEFHELLEDAWQFDLKEDPLRASEVGDHRYDHLLPNVSLADERRRAEANRTFLSRLESIARDGLSRTDQVSYDIFDRRIRRQLREYEFETFLMPISDRYGFHVEFPELARNTSLITLADYENYIARLRGFKSYTTGHIELMREGIKRGLTPPSLIMQRFAEPLESQIVDDPEKSALYTPLAKFPDTVPEGERDRLRADARAAIAESVVPGYQLFLKFMRDEYLPNCRTTIAASALPHGREYYRHCIGAFTTLDDLTPEEVHAIGNSEVARIRNEMIALIDKVGFEGDFDEFTKYLRTEPKFYASSPEALEKEVAYILKRMDGQLPTLFGHLPRTPYGIRRIPDYIAPQATTAYYLPSTGDGTRAGYYYINTFNLPSRPLYMLEALSFHEAVPGHHLQLAIQKELDSLPNFRKYGGDTAFVEGWALYSERLGLESGFYEDPYSDFGRLTMEMWRACRLVVDTGIHYFGWTHEQAIDFMKNNSAMPVHDIRAEVYRYIGWPGQALAYKIGELRIRELREEAERQLGEHFDIRAFHDVVLGDGSVPLDVLEKNVRAWIHAFQAVQASADSTR